MHPGCRACPALIGSLNSQRCSACWMVMIAGKPEKRMASSVLIDDDATSVWRRDLYQAAEWLTLWGLNEAAVAALKLLQRKHPARTADGVLLFRRPCRSIS